MGKNVPGKRDGTGPYKTSYQRQQTGGQGKRQLQGIVCPKTAKTPKKSK